MEFKSKLIGKHCNIKDNIDSMWAGEWGIIEYFDGEMYHIAMYGGDAQPIFSRDEIHIPRKWRGEIN